MLYHFMYIIWRRVFTNSLAYSSPSRKRNTLLSETPKTIGPIEQQEQQVLCNRTSHKCNSIKKITSLRFISQVSEDFQRFLELLIFKVRGCAMKNVFQSSVPEIHHFIVVVRRPTCVRWAFYATSCSVLFTVLCSHSLLL